MSQVELFTAKSITFNYDRVADRICLELGDRKQENFHRAWLTRRYLQQMVPQVANWMDERCPLIEEAALPLTSEQKAKVASFEHSHAVQSVPMQKSPAPKPEEKRVTQSYLLKGIELSEKNGVITLVFINTKGQPVSGMRMSRNELHKLLSCLLDLGNREGWGLHSPWTQTTTVPVPGVFSASRH